MNAVVPRGTSSEHSHQLARALALNMAAWFRPTADNYFLHLSKTQIIRDIEDIGRSTLRDAAKLKKATVATFAERRAAENEAWVPALLRTPEAA